MADDERHDHWIIQQIMPAPADCFTVWAAWDELTDSVATVEQVRVPGFALIVECSKVFERDTDDCGPDPDGYQIIRPLVYEDYDGYMPLHSEIACINRVFLGIYYENEPEPLNWLVLAQEAFARAKKKKKGGEVTNGG
jgi:hypothetical protein